METSDTKCKGYSDACYRWQSLHQRRTRRALVCLSAWLADSDNMLMRFGLVWLCCYTSLCFSRQISTLTFPSLRLCPHGDTGITESELCFDRFQTHAVLMEEIKLMCFGKWHKNGIVPCSVRKNPVQNVKYMTE